MLGSVDFHRYTGNSLRTGSRLRGAQQIFCSQAIPGISLNRILLNRESAPYNLL